MVTVFSDPGKKATYRWWMMHWKRIVDRRANWMAALLLSVPVVLSGCQGALPSEKQSMISPWSTFDQAKKSYDLIIPNYTTTEELEQLGYDPYRVPNVGILTYLDIIQRFIPTESIKVEDLDEGIQRCIRAREACYAYEATPSWRKKKRYGSVTADVMGFQKKERTIGWNFNALVVLIDDVVVYKIWGGVPNYVEDKKKRTPLGPIQNNMDDIKGII